jgi:hypothetical protein
MQGGGGGGVILLNVEVCEKEQASLSSATDKRVVVFAINVCNGLTTKLPFAQSIMLEGCD